MLELKQTWEAACVFHEALGVSPQDPIATDLLGRALEENASMQGWGSNNAGEGLMGMEEEAFTDFIGKGKKALQTRAAKGKGKARGPSLGKGQGRVCEVLDGDDSTMIMSDVG